jgi:hypothetical protein
VAADIPIVDTVKTTDVGWSGCPVDVAAVRGAAFSWNCGRPLTFSGNTSTWTGVDLPMTIDGSVVPYGYTSPAEDGFVVEALVPIVDASGYPRGHDSHLWFWKPPEQ